MSKKNLKKAYSLIELSIVIVIISILITGALTVSVGSVNNAKVKLTNDRMKEIYKAFQNYFLINGKLPCPADITQIKSSSSSYGTAIGSDGACSGSGTYIAPGTDLVYGMVPVKTLNLSNDMAEDGFESKFTYIVNVRLTDETTFDSDFSAGANPAYTINMIENPSGRTAGADFIILSHGANKAGAFNSNSSAQNTRSADGDELNNDVNPSSSPYFNNTIISASGNSDVFDDVVLFKRRVEIVSDSGGMQNVKCTDAGAAFGNVNANYGQIVYATSSCSTPNEDKRLTKKCEAFGQWVNIVAACP